MNVDKAIFSPSKEEAITLRVALMQMRQKNELTNDHIAVMNHYLNKGTPPDPARVKEARAYHVWSDLMTRLRERCGGHWSHEFA